MTLFMGQDPELEGLERVRDALAADSPNPLAGKTLVDVGANIGTTTVGALSALGMSRAVCLEPLPLNLRLLRHNLLANDLTERVRVLDVALSDRPGSVEFEIHPGNPSDARVRVPGAGPGTDRYGESGWEAVTVRTATFDGLAGEGEIPLEDLGLVWIDAQGHEGHILDGASSLLSEPVPVVVEFWPYGLERAGGMERLLAVIEGTFTRVIDLKDGTSVPPAALGEHAGRLGATGHTDLLLLH